jgi:UDP-N-acetylmuramoyl-tripeptide--D-alanyl-D-alanine ligase
VITLAQALHLLQARVPEARIHGDVATVFTRVHSDTRTLKAGDLFVALRGERFDANDFLPQAQAAGAVAALCERECEGLPSVIVPDAKAALGHLAAAWRTHCHLPLIAVTGSNGKTTVTQMIASILRAWVAEHALATEGNYNNDIGVPLTLLRLRQDDGLWHRAAVVELGMNHPGEIAPLAAMAQPCVALVNNAQREHQEFMQTVEAAARENGAVIEALAPSGTAVFPADDDCAPIWHALAGSRPVLSFALQGEADVTADAQWMGTHWALAIHTPSAEIPVALRMPGQHNIKNALAAAACALAAGAPLAAIRQGLDSFEPVKGRSQLKSFTRDGQTITLIDDSYNANPDSVRAAIDVLAGLPGASWLVLGDMGEVGDQGPAFHAEVGAYAAERGIEHFWSAGAACADAARAYGPAARHFPTVAELLAALTPQPDAQNILVKGSRFMKMEQVVSALTTQGGAHAA